MKRSAVLLILVFLLPASFALSQNPGAPDPYKPTLDRLAALTRKDETEWRFHTDVPHPEDPGVNDSDWGALDRDSGVPSVDSDPGEDQWLRHPGLTCVD